MSPQSRRILRALEDAPDGLTTWELTMATSVLNLTARISELRTNVLEPEGRTIRCDREGDHYRYRLVSLHPVQLTLPAA